MVHTVAVRIKTDPRPNPDSTWRIQSQFVTHHAAIYGEVESRTVRNECAATADGIHPTRECEGAVDLGVKAQLEEIERGFFDLLEHREPVRRDELRAGTKLEEA